MALEVPGEMRLIVEAHAGRHLSDGLSVQQSPPRGLDPTGEEVAVRRDAEPAGEAPDEMRRRHVEDVSCLRQRQRFEAVLIEEVPEIGRDAVVGSRVGRVDPIAEVLGEARAHHGEHRLRREGFIRISQGAMEHVEVPNERRILDVGIVDGPADQPLDQNVGPEVEHSLAESRRAGGSSIVHDVRRQDRHPGAGGAAMSSLEVVTDRALVDDEHRPRVVRVRRVGMVDEPRVEHLVDAGNRRLPSANPLAPRGQQATIVQDLLRPAGLGWMDGGWIPPGAVVNELVAFLGFALVGTVSPGPNNTVLWASGMTFGLRRTTAHILGTALGMGALVLGVAAGIGALFDAVPVAELLLKVVGSAYLLWIAFHVVGGGGIGRTEVPHPLSAWQGAVFQWVNPKAWVFTIAAVGTFLPRALPRPVGAILLTGILMVVVVGSSSIWAAGGAALGRVVEDERRRRAVGIALAILLVASVALIWIE